MDLLMETSSRTPDIDESPLYDEALEDEPQEHNKPSSEAEIRSHVAWVIRSVSQSINDRTFDSAPAWEYIADDFLVSPAAPRIPTRTRAELAESFKSFAAEHHDFRVDLPRCETEVDMLQGCARTFATSHGFSGAVHRKYVVLFTFVRDREGRWTARNESTMFGVL